MTYDLSWTTETQILDLFQKTYIFARNYESDRTIYNFLARIYESDLTATLPWFRNRNS